MRILLAGLAAVASYYFAYWVGSALLSFVVPFQAASVAGTVLALGAAWFAARTVLRRTPETPGGLGAAMGRGALIVGAIGFVGGFFGPMIFAPGANQGPMLGIFITGPGGVLAGAIGGAIYWFLKQKGGSTPS